MLCFTMNGIFKPQLKCISFNRFLKKSPSKAVVLFPNKQCKCIKEKSCQLCKQLDKLLKILNQNTLN